MFFKSKKVIGLDIGTSSIKLAELDVSKAGAVLQGFRVAPTPVNAISGGEVIDPGSLGSTVRSLYRELKSKRKSVATGMWGTAVIVKKITMPAIRDRKALAESIRLEAEQYIPFDIQHVSLAHHVLGGAGDTTDVLLIAAQNELVSQYNSVIDLAGLSCDVIDVSGFALANCFEMNYGRFAGENIGLLNFGASVTNFVVISNGEVIFCRDVPVGGQLYTNEISKSMGVSMQEAEMLKLSAVARQEVPDEVVSLISSTNEQVAEEVRNSLDFLNATTNGLSLTRCLVTGGASTTTGLMDAVSRVSGLPLEPFNPFLRVKANPKKVSPEMMEQVSPMASIVLGLAMREVGDA